jgi:hypothetical protein
MEQAMYMQIVPNSHSFGSLENIITHATFKSEEITREYLLIGFKNTLELGLKLVLNEKKMGKIASPYHFASLESIILHLEAQNNFDLEYFIDVIHGTLNNGYDLKKINKNMGKMKRKKVYKCLDTERDYQDLRWTPRREANGTPDEQKPPAEWINYIEYHISKAKEQVYLLQDEEALAEVRKVAALAVRCLELHGCPKRVIPEELLNQE